MGLLCLSRLVNEEIAIGDDIRILVVDIRGDRVRLGIEAPQEIPVNRLEVHEAILKRHKVDSWTGSRWPSSSESRRPRSRLTGRVASLATSWLRQWSTPAPRRCGWCVPNCCG